MYRVFKLGNWKRKDDFEDLGADGWIILKIIYMKMMGRRLTGFI
jgi:hypothetical protein